MTNWITDDEILDATNQMHTAFNYMFADEPTGVTPAVVAAQRAMPHHQNCVLALDPGKIRDEYDQMFEAAMRIGDNEQAVANIRLTADHLSAWTGDAADAFKRQLTYMETFCDRQQTLILETLRGVAAVYALAVAGRASYLSIVNAAHAAAINVHDEQQTKDTQLQVNLIANLVKGVVDMDPRGLTRSFLDTAIDVGKDVATHLLDDSGADQVGDDYRRRADELCQSMGHALDDVRDGFDKLRDSEPMRSTELFTPLKAEYYVDSPNFTYEHFKNEHHSPGPIGPAVEAERQKYVDEKKTVRDGEIDRRLNQSGKGEV